MGTREKSALYPNATWEDCLDFIRTIDSFKLKSVSYVEVAKRYGLSSTTTKSFTSKISSSKQYGLITTSNGNTIQLTENSMKLLYPTGNDSRELELECFSSPPIYAKLIEVYDGKAIPSENLLGNVLMNDYKIARSVKDRAARCFIQSATQLGIVQGGVLTYSDSFEYKSDNSTAKNRLSGQMANEPDDIPVTPITNKYLTSSSGDIENEYISQSLPMQSGKVAKLIIPMDADEDSLLLLKDMFEAILKRKFKISLD